MTRRPWKPRRQASDLLLSSTARGTILFLAGLGLTIREALVSGPDRPSLYVLYALMMGLPIVWNTRPPEPPGQDDRCND